MKLDLATIRAAMYDVVGVGTESGSNPYHIGPQASATSGYSTGVMQTDFSKKLDRADRLEAAYKAFAADPNNGVSAIDELANKLASTPTDNTGLSTSERKDLDRFLNSSTGKALADDFDRQQVSDLMNTVVAKIDATPYFSKLSEADQFTVLSTAVKQVNSLTSSVAARLDATRYFSKLPQPAQKVAL